jgi:putative sporulation protein YtaF
MLDELILTLAVSVDIFIMSISCGMDGVNVPIQSAISMSVVGTVVMAVATVLSSLVDRLVPKGVCVVISCVVLCTMGLMNVTKCVMERYRTYRHSKHTPLEDSKLLGVYICGSRADCDHSKDISIKEAVSVALLMSLDILVCGTVSSASLNAWMLCFGVFIVQTLAVMLGSYIGKKFSKVPNISFIGGLLLILLGITKLI